MKYEKILQIEKTTSGFNQEQFLAKKNELANNRHDDYEKLIKNLVQYLTE